jgi:hypothetical protein
MITITITITIIIIYDTSFHIRSIIYSDNLSYLTDTEKLKYNRRYIRNHIPDALDLMPLPQKPTNVTQK